MPPWYWALALLAMGKAVLGIVAFTTLAWSPVATLAPQSHSGFRFVHVLVYAIVAVWLIGASRKDRRAAWLGGVFLLASSSSADVLFAPLADGYVPVLSATSSLLLRIQPDAFLPLFLWLFFREFPKALPYGSLGPISRFAVRLSAAAGLLLFAIYAAPLVIASDELGFLAPGQRLNLYSWALLVALSIASLVFAIYRSRFAPPVERRRLRIFLSGLAVGCGPMFVALLLQSISPAVHEWMAQPRGSRVIGPILRLFLISVPVSTAYAVLVHHVLDVRLVLRKAVQYALAQYSLIVVATAPLLWMLGYLYVHREESMTSLLSGRHLILLASVSALGFVAMKTRKVLIGRIDRHFFRDHYDARRIMLDLVERCRSLDRPEPLEALLERELDRAFHVERVALLTRVPGSDSLRSPRGLARPLRTSWLLTQILESSTEPLSVDLETTESPLRQLSQLEQHWLADSAFAVLVPLLSSDNKLLGVLGLGEKRSELPFSPEDRRLVSGIAASTSLTLENQMVRASSGHPHPRAQVGRARIRRSGVSVPRVPEDSGRGGAGVLRVPCWPNTGSRSPRAVG